MNLLHPPAQVEIALGGTILSFLVPHVPEEFDRGGATVRHASDFSAGLLSPVSKKGG